MNVHSSVLLAALVLGGCHSDSVRDADSAGAYAALVKKTVPEVEQAVGLHFKRAPKVEARTKEEVRQFLERQFADTRAAKDLAGTEMSYKLFGLLPDTMHLKRELEDLLAEQIVGFYDPETKVLYVVDGAPEAEVSEVVAHELVHALQDQYIDLDSIQKVEHEDDRTSAAQAVIEGQAVYDQMVVATGNKNFIAMMPGGWDRVRQAIRENQSSMPTFANAPMVLQETLIFPYLSGAEFMRHFADHDAGKEPYDSLMPTSTKQILHPETAFFGKRDIPTRVTLPPVPHGDSVLYQNTLGEFQTRLFLYQHLNDQKASIEGASGWEGDRYQVVQTADGHQILIWVTVWDSPVDAASFRDLAMQANTERRPLRPDRTVTVTPIEIQGRPSVLYVDAPKGMSQTGTSTSHLIDANAIRLSPEP